MQNNFTRAASGLNYVLNMLMLVLPHVLAMRVYGKRRGEVVSASLLIIAWTRRMRPAHFRGMWLQQCNHFEVVSLEEKSPRWDHFLHYENHELSSRPSAKQMIYLWIPMSLLNWNEERFVLFSDLFCYNHILGFDEHYLTITL